MAHVKQISQRDATGTVAAIYTAARKRGGDVANIIKVMSNDARSMRGSMQFYVSLMKVPNSLAAARREMLAAVVSNANECYY